MTDFFLAAFPWIAMGLGMAISITYLDQYLKKNKKEDE